MGQGATVDIREAAALGQPWLSGALPDAVFILAPPLLAAAACLLTAWLVDASAGVGIGLWLVLIVGIDVAHVYSTLWLTYLRPDARRKRALVLIAVPTACWVIGALLYTVSALLFWRILAYLAVFHFVRQQYGLMRLYYRNQPETSLQRTVRAGTIYLSTLWPLAYWHTHPRVFSWFVDGDFLNLHTAPWIADVTLLLLVCCGAMHLALELRDWRVHRRFNLPANLVVAGTLASWSVGIVLFDGDLVFTLTNVVAHGIPYTALVWMTARRAQKTEGLTRNRAVWRRSVLVFLALLIAAAFVEEALWDRFVWHERDAVFGWLGEWTAGTSSEWAALAVATLAVPQATHYVLDGLIWRRAPWP